MPRYEVSPEEFRRERAFMRRILAISVPVALALSIALVALFLLDRADSGLSFLIKVAGVGITVLVFWFFVVVTVFAYRHQEPMVVDDDAFVLDSVSMRPRRRRYEDVESARHNQRGGRDWAVLLRMKDGSEIGVLPHADTPREVYALLLERLRDRGVPVSVDESLPP